MHCSGLERGRDSPCLHRRGEGSASESATKWPPGSKHEPGSRPGPPMTHDVVWRERWQVDENLSCITLLAIAIPRLRRNQPSSIGEKARVELRHRSSAVPAWFACIPATCLGGSGETHEIPCGQRQSFAVSTAC